MSNLLKGIERICAPFINIKLIESIEAELEPLEKDDQHCFRYCKWLIKDADEKILKNAELSITGNRVNVVVKAGKCENEICVSLNHRDEPYHYPTLPKWKPTEQDVVHYHEGENKYTLICSEEITLESIAKVEARMKSHEFNEAMRQCLLFANTVISEERQYMKNAELKIHCDGKIVLIYTVICQDPKSQLKICIALDNDGKPFKTRDPNDNNGATSKRKPTEKDVVHYNEGENTYELHCSDEITLESVTKVQATIKPDAALQQCLLFANRVISEEKQYMKNAELKIYCDGKIVLIYTVIPQDPQSQLKIYIALDDDGKPFKIRVPPVKRPNEECIKYNCINDGDNLLKLTKCSCGRIDYFYKILTVRDVEDLIKRAESLNDKQLECLKCSRDLIEERIKNKHNVPLVNFEVIVLPESKCAGKHWRLFTGAGTNSYTITWNKARKRAYWKNTSKTTTQAALETVQLLLPNYLRTRSMKCANCNAIIKAVCGSWFERRCGESPRRLVCTKCKAKIFNP